MKLLLDENLPTKLKDRFDTSHEVITVREAGWSGVKNGLLLALMAENGFDALVTMDKNLRFQQNTGMLPVKLIVFDALNNKIDTLGPFVQKLSETLKDSSLGSLDKITIITI
jgi:predicted nuclease of predicted toxin-antitoxin system